MSRRLIEAGKNLLIILLCVSALFLAGKTELFSTMKDSVPFVSSVIGWFKTLRGDAEEPNTGAVAFKEAAVPLSAAVTGLGGQHCGIKYDGTALKYFYERTGSVLGKALSSATAPEEITSEVWRRALQAPGIFYDYRNSVPAEALSGWFGAEQKCLAEGSSIRRLCISNTEKNGVALYYRDETSGRYFRSYTSVLYSTLSAYIGEYLPNGAFFAFELSVGDAVYNTADPDALLLGSSPSIFAVNAENPFFDGISLSELLNIFKVNLRLSEHYTEYDDTEVYVEERYSLRLGKDGTASYHSSRSPGNRLAVASADSVPSFAEMLDSAHALAAASAGSECGAAELLYTGFSLQDGEYSFIFEYYVNGIAVNLPLGAHAAEIKISGSYITSANFVFRTFAVGSELLSPLPERQAAVLVSKPSGEAELRYADIGGGRFEADWAEK